MHPLRREPWVRFPLRPSDQGATEILRHAVGIARIGARRGAAVIVVDPYDAGSEKFWRRLLN